jgi:hypothetical protein
MFIKQSIRHMSYGLLGNSNLKKTDIAIIELGGCYDFKITTEIT